MAVAVPLKRLRDRWLRPSLYVNALVAVPWVLLLIAPTVFRAWGASPVAILALSGGLLLMTGVGLLDAFVFRLSQSRVRRTPTGKMTRSDIIGVLLFGVTLLSVVVTALNALATRRWTAVPSSYTMTHQHTTEAPAQRRRGLLLA